MMRLEDTYRHKGLRKRLVDTLINKGISQKQVLRAILKVPRHIFMDTAFVEHAYEDKAFGIGEGQTISQPYTVAFQTELLDVTPGEKILEIGTGSGYQSSVLMEIGCNLYTIEYNKVLFERAKRLLNRMGYKAHFICGDGTKGFLSAAPYDKILVTAGAPDIPVPLLKQLKVGGKLVIPVGDTKHQKMLRITKIEEDKFEKREFGDFSFVKLLGESGW
ncbi:MAG: protein-L-isoaspartate O-methyltransferase [Thalassobius sp.]|nr:protein-L-isoaspartate O-methyltransferase [Thalassovita sp.]